MWQNDIPPTARQRDYAAALGIDLPADATRDTVSSLIDEAKAGMDGPLVPEQVEFARSLCLHLPSSVKTRRECTDLLYRYLIARRWVYSVLRHVARARWRQYSQSGMPERTVAEISLAIMHNAPLFEKLREKTAGNSERGADVWIRMSAKEASTPEYQFVKDYQLPVEVIRAMVAAQRQRAPAFRPSTKKEAVGGPARRTTKDDPSGCVVLAFMMFLGAIMAGAAIHGCL
jgi:hypothetical protein